MELRQNIGAGITLQILRLFSIQYVMNNNYAQKYTKGYAINRPKLKNDGISACCTACPMSFSVVMPLALGNQLP